MCFERLIGLKGSCNDGTLPSDGMWLNSLGISRDFVESIINEDWADVDDFVLDTIHQAEDALKSDVYAHFTTKFAPKSIIDGARIGYYLENPTLTPSLGGDYKGVQMRIWNDTTFAKLYVQKIQTYFNYTGNVTLTVWDLNQSKAVDTITVASVANEIVTTEVNRTYRSDFQDLNLIIIYPSTFQSYQTGFDGFGCVTCYRGGAYMQNRYVWSTGVTLEDGIPATQANIQSQSDTGGISLIYALQCDHDAWFCQNANFFVSAALYKCTYLICQYAALMSNTFSSTNMDVERLKDRMVYCDNEYNKRLDAGLKNLRIPASSTCFVCNEVRRIITQLPS